MAVYIIIAIISYLIGSIAVGVIIGKKMAGVDVRDKGSKASGATNVLRTVGKKAAGLTLLGDILKGIVAILIAYIVGNIIKDIDRAFLIQIAGIFVVLGHTFPIFYKFKGGKGVATSLGILILTNWQIGLICLVFAIVLIALSRMVSLGSVGAAILYPVLTIFISEHYLVEGNYFIYSVILAIIVVFNHRENIKRLLDGKENKLNFSK